jgi:catechol 2,3-dioxygenase-like lactoylglutathione lyase family enzyme
MQLNAARVFVTDLAEAESFYGGVLGFTLVAGGSNAGYCVFAAGQVQLVVEPVAADAAQEDQELVGRFTGLSFSVASVEDQYRRLVALGVVFTGAPERQPWGGVLATFRDPAGNSLQLVQPPSAA